MGIYIFFFKKHFILSTPECANSLLLQVIIRVKELILLITPFSHVEEKTELSKEANQLYVKSNQSVFLWDSTVEGS